MNKFPDEVNEDGFSVPEVGWGGGFYDKLDVDAWFKRCISRFPDMVDIMERNRTGPHRFNTLLQYHLEVDEWFTTWFSQFIEKGEESG